MAGDDYQSYRRGEMTMALWRALAANVDFEDPKYASPPSVFANRIKRLLDIDQQAGTQVFYEETTAGKGSVADYEEFGIFKMGIALLLLDAGFVQQDVHFVLRHIKEKLWLEYQYIVAHPSSLTQYIAAEDTQGSPALLSNPIVADTAVFMLIRKSELKECRAGVDLQKPFIFVPTFCHGGKNLVWEVERLGFQRPSVIIIEVSELLTNLKHHLDRDTLTRAMTRAKELKRIVRKNKAPTVRRPSGAPIVASGISSTPKVSKGSLPARRLKIRLKD